MRRFLASMSAAAAVLAVLFCASVVLGQPKPANFKKGQFEARVGGKTYVGSLFGGSLTGQVLQAIYIGTGTSDADASIALGGVTGPGKFGNSIIISFNVMAGGADWTFEQGKHNCTFTFSRFGTGGIDGTVSCTGTGGNAVPWSQGKFTALP